MISIGKNEDVEKRKKNALLRFLEDIKILKAHKSMKNYPRKKFSTYFEIHQRFLKSFISNTIFKFLSLKIRQELIRIFENDCIAI